MCAVDVLSCPVLMPVAQAQSKLEGVLSSIGGADDGEPLEWELPSEEETDAAALIHRIEESYYLINVVDNDYRRGNIFDVFDDALNIIKNGSRVPSSTGVS